MITIYKASAGSGKTYTLTREYLKIIFENEYNYKNILAVTFTNKAAEEMKSRIVNEVYLISIGSNKSDHAEFLKNKFKFTDVQLVEKAKAALNLLLHDYSRFSVGTIDSFFQQIIRSFAKEIGLQNGFQLELNQNEILEKAVDKLISQIDDDNNLRKWLMVFANDRMREGKSWNFKDEILKIGKEIFKEEYSINSKKITDKLKEKEFIFKYKQTLSKIKDSIVNDIKKIGANAIELMQVNDISLEDFPYKTTSFASYFVKFKNGDFTEPGKRVVSAVANIDKWYSKKSDKITEIEQFYNDGGNQLLILAIETYLKNKVLFNSVNEVLKLINYLAIIDDVFKNAHKVSTDENIFLLAFAGPFIKSIIADTDTPFLYEKIGNKYKYFMIDEFQDTSTIQWDNFKPLIEESIANKHSSIIVGDVKQSIYRWRNGDWKLLAGGVEESFYKGAVNYETLTYNWRSKKNIIDFNNSIFKDMANILQQNFNKDIADEHTTDIEYLKDSINNAYNDITQIYPAKKDEKDKGYVKIEFINKEKGETVDDVKLKALERIPQFLEQMQDANIPLKDIAILVRGKKEGTEIVNYIMEYKKSSDSKLKYKYDIISNEALVIGNSPSIKLLVSLIKDVFIDNDDINTAYIKYEYNSVINKKNIELTQIFNKQNNLFPNEYLSIKERLSKLSLYEITENLISIFKLNNNENNFIYLQAFKDALREFSETNIINIDNFIEWWENTGNGISVRINEEQDAVKIITIHKSKGLEFKTVLIPFANWKFKPINNEIFWCSSNEANFNELKILPLKDTGRIKDTVFYKNYYNEKLHNYIDNINMLYVAFTRAEENLVVFAEYSKPKDAGINNTGVLLKNTLESKVVDNVYKLGSLTKQLKEELAESNTIEKYISGNFKHDNSIKIASTDYVTSFENDKIKKGLLYHKIFENIKYKYDIKNAVLKLINDGYIPDNNLNKYVNEINTLISKPEVVKWFDGTYKIKNEASIQSSKTIKRPDRLMLKNDEIIIVDYKFGHKKEPKYHKQLIEYSNLIAKMGYKNIKAYIWYVLLDTVEKIN